MLYAGSCLADERYLWHPPSETYLAVFIKYLFQYKTPWKRTQHPYLTYYVRNFDSWYALCQVIF